MTVEFKDYYATLGVARTASAQEIQAAYRALARRTHPDVDKTTGATKRFQEIGEAYEVLKDPQKRARYDALGSAWKDGQPFEGPTRPRARRAQARSASFDDLRGFSSFFESLFGDHVTFDARAGGADTFESDGARVRGAHGAADVHAILPIAPWEAVLGAKVPFQAPDGSQVTLTIPRGSSSGSKLRLRGLGGHGANGARGSLIVELSIVVPSETPAAETKLWEELARTSRFDPRA